MGCVNALPKAEAFLAPQQPAPALLDSAIGLDKLYMKPWPCGANGNSGKLDGSILPITDPTGQVVMQISTARKNQSCGTHVTEMMDAEGRLVAVLETESKETLTPMAGWSKTWHHIYSVKPFVDGHVPARAYKNVQLYSWARVCRKPFTNSCDIYLYGAYDEKSEPVFKLNGFIGLPPRQFSIESASGGAALFTKTKGKMIEINAAPHADLALMISTTVCVLKLIDEIPSGNGGAGGGGM